MNSKFEGNNRDKGNNNRGKKNNKGNNNRKNKKKSKKSRPQVEDEQELLPEGACGGDEREFGSPERTNSSQSTTSSRNTPESGNSTTPLISPKKTGKHGKSQTKGSFYESPAKSSSRDSTRPRPRTSRKNEDSMQSASSSRPSVAEQFEIAESKHPSDKNLLTVPGQSTEDDRSSPERKGFFSSLRDRISPKRNQKSKNAYSDSKCSCVNNPNHEVGCSLRKHVDEGAKNKTTDKTNNRSQTESETSSSSSSRICKKGMDGNASSDNSTSPSSKSLGAIPKWSHRGKSERSPNRLEPIIPPPSDDPRDYDPKEMASMDKPRKETVTPKIVEPNKRKSPLRLVPGIDLNRHVRRERTESNGSYFRNLWPMAISSSSSPKRMTPSEFSEKLAERERAIRAHRARMNVAERDTESDRTDEEGPVQMREARSTWLAPAVRRHESESPRGVRRCDCNPNGKAVFHNYGCAREIDLRRRRKRRACKQSVPPSSSEDDTERKDKDKDKRKGK